MIVDNMLHVQLEVELGECHRLSTSFVRWLACILTECPVLLQTAIGLTVRDSVVGALIALAADNDSTVPDLVDCTTSSQHLARRALTCFVQSTEITTIQSVGLPIPQSVANSRLIRQIATTALCDHVTSLTNFSLMVIGELIMF